MDRDEHVKWFWLFFAGSAAVVVGLGAWAMRDAGLPAGLWLRNPIAMCVGAGAAWYMCRLRHRMSWTAPFAVVVVAATFIGIEQSGVHRWIGFGSVQINAAALVLPMAIASIPERKPRFILACFVVSAALLAFQPDLSQVTALAAAAVCYAGLAFHLRGLLMVVPIAFAAVSVCAGRPDPLLPVAHVEGIIDLATDQNSEIGISLALHLGFAALSPLLLWFEKDLRPRAVALSAYFCICAVAVVFGAFPVPLAGYGISYVLGWWLGAAALFRSSGKPAFSSISLHIR